MSRKLAIDGGEATVPQDLKIRWPIITEEDKKAVCKVLERGILCDPFSPEVTGLEKDFATYLGTDYCITTNSGTSALHLAVAAAGAGPGNEVITPAFSFLASAICILHHNAIPIFVDIDPRTFNIDPNKIEKKISKRTKAIIVVHIHGLPADMNEIMDIAFKNNLVVIEDACQAHGATYYGKKTGTLGHMAAFSLNSQKNLPGGEGGLFVTDSKEYYERANMVRMFGEEYIEPNKRSYVSYSMGWMYRSQELPAALARSQLRRLDKINENTRRNARYLNNNLSDIKYITCPFVPENRTHVYHKYRIRLNPEKLNYNISGKVFRDCALSALQTEGVETSLWQTIPLPDNPLFKKKEGYGKGCPWSCRYSGKVDYSQEYYPATQNLIENSLVIGSAYYPLYSQKLELMKYYSKAIHKVFDNIDRIIERHCKKQESKLSVQ